MDRRNSPFQRTCRWCGDAFLARQTSDTCCSLGCSEEIFQHAHELSLVQHEFSTLNEKVEELHERIYRIHRRIERQVMKLQKLGAQWASTPDGDELFAIERREKRISLILNRLNNECYKRDLQAIPAERKLFHLERAVEDLRRLIGDS